VRVIERVTSTVCVPAEPEAETVAEVPSQARRHVQREGVQIL
jgi:hypothetical protein